MLISLALLLTVIGAAYPAAVFREDDCVSVTENRLLSTDAKLLRHFRSHDFSHCIDECIIGHFAHGCTRIVYNRRTNFCSFYGKESEGISESLEPSRIHTYAAMNVECYGLNTAHFRRRRDHIKPKKYNPWGEWAPCPVTCGIGQRLRSRTCRRRQVCEDGSLSETKDCSPGPCPEWATWAAWSPCSVTCGDGVCKRTRQCTTYSGCVGNREEQKPCSPGTCAKWSVWQQWGSCSKLCGGGIRTRTRSCSVYGGCPGKASEALPCNTQACCTAWGNWGQCSVTCTTDPPSGNERRTRRCTVESTGTAGGYSSEEQSEARPCSANLPPCGEWSSWSHWGQCSVTCAGGERTKTRSCSVQGACEGQATQSSVCHTEACPSWASWNPWTLCSASCAGGSQSRRRICSVTGQCDGDANQEQTCNTNACPEWTTWAPWSSCSESCGGGWKNRGRVCNQYNLCPGDKKEKTACNTHTCPSHGNWGSWGECSKDCGGGVQTRTRPCVKDATYCTADKQNDAACMCEGTAEEGQPCHEHTCSGWSNWGEWGSCSAECDGGKRTRTRNCQKDTTFCVGANANHPSCICEGVDNEEGDCHTHQCPMWSTWGAWGSCSASCGGGAKERKRTCQYDDTYCAADKMDTFSCKCPGLDHSNDQCNAHMCPNLTPWGSWGECTSSCAGGEMVRVRVCELDTNFCGANPTDPTCECDAAVEEVAECNKHTCAHITDWSEWASCSASCGGGVRTRNRKCNVDSSFCFGDNANTHPSCKCTDTTDDEGTCNAHLCPSYETWGDWGECTASCGSGVRTRNRPCALDVDFCVADKVDSDPSCKCVGDAENQEECNGHTCPKYSEWGNWNECSVSCGGGVNFRQRECKMDTNYCVGSKLNNDPACKCVGDFEDPGDCNTFACPTYTEWGTWSICSTTCDAGERNRKRDCNVDSDHCVGVTLQEPECQCEGNDLSVEDCELRPCVSWSSWESWSECTRVCGGGSRNRARKCPTPGACPGLTTAEEFCNQLPCPDWGSWAIWSSCSVTCGGGKRVRTRSCPLEGGCSPGEPTDHLDCNDQTCPIWAQWGEWSQCTATCGEGEMIRKRSCTPPDGCLGRTESYQPCNQGSCELTNNWSGWSPCTQTCGAGGVKKRSRLECIDPGCAVETETAECNEELLCPEWGQWVNWSTCSKTCGSGSRTRSRKCEDVTSGADVTGGCVGAAAETDPNPCNSFGC